METALLDPDVPRSKLLRNAVEDQNQAAAIEIIENAVAGDQRRIISELNEKTREGLCELLPVEVTAGLFEHLAEAQAVEILEDMPADLAADVVEEMDPELGGDLLRELDAKDSSAILEEIEDREESAELRERAGYDAESAGGLMQERAIAFLEDSTVSAVLGDLERNAEEYSDADVQYLYVTDAGGRLKGVLSLRGVVLGGGATAISRLMRPDPVSVTVDTPLEDLEDIFEEKEYFGLPVVDRSGQLKGVVSRAAVTEALAENQTDDYLKAAGIVGGEELRSMPLRDRCTRRLAWLGPNILLNLLAASVIARYEGTLEAVIALAVFLPMVSDMSGCSGNQAVAVSIRELTLDIIRPRDFLRVMVKEGMLGIINGIVLGIVLGIIATIWKGNVWLGGVIGLALALNTVLSVLLGGIVPLLLKRFKADPALASGPILTTCTDMFGFFLVLNLASLALTKLV